MEAQSDARRRWSTSGEAVGDGRGAAVVVVAVMAVVVMLVAEERRR